MSKCLTDSGARCHLCQSWMLSSRDSGMDWIDVKWLACWKHIYFAAFLVPVFGKGVVVNGTHIC